ncbi:hypothetical protein [Streptomyces sp. NPDC045251]|uniref:hypothetical protein n=1 Tax=unclassified Streptomyces TaxID=2593676 RepID=UPI003408D5E9
MLPTPGTSPSGPSTPAPAQAAAIVMEASNDPGWGMFVWLTTTTDVRSAELCAVRWDDIDLDGGVLTVRPDPARGAARERSVGLAPQTVTLLRAHLAHCAAQAAMLGIERLPGAYVFSPTPDGGMPPDPAEVAARHVRTCADLGWDTRSAGLPRFGVAELIAAGVDLRALNWRLQRGLSRIQRRPKA